MRTDKYACGNLMWANFTTNNNLGTLKNDPVNKKGSHELPEFLSVAILKYKISILL